MVTSPKRPTELMAHTPSMSWADHVDASRKSKLRVAWTAVAALLFIGGLILGGVLFT